MLKKLIRDEHGQDMIEWGMLAAFISVVAIIAVDAIGGIVKGWYDTIQTDITNPTP
ncbi:MAG TPA: Flp family type IVb pilin [bacterium]|nr:Flp family type IVb pilin [bacterium]